MRKLITSSVSVAIAAVLLLVVTAPVAAVSVETMAPLDVYKGTSATLRLSYNMGGYFNVGYVGFHYRETGHSWIWTGWKWVMGGGTYQKEVTGLTSGARHYVIGWAHRGGVDYNGGTLSFITSRDKYNSHAMYDGYGIGKLWCYLWITSRSSPNLSWVQAEGEIESTYIFGAEGEVVLQHYTTTGTLVDTDSDYVQTGGGIYKNVMAAATSGPGSSTVFAIWRYRAIGHAYSSFSVRRIETRGSTINLYYEWDLAEELEDEYFSGNWWQALLDWIYFFFQW